MPGIDAALIEVPCTTQQPGRLSLSLSLVFFFFLFFHFGFRLKRFADQNPNGREEIKEHNDVGRIRL
jgi:hypothetical protein